MCFTYNNYDEAGEQRFQSSDRLAYLVYGRETGKSGTKHLQGYLEINGQLSFRKLVTLFPGVHFEPRRGTAAEAVTYCQKDGDVFERGTCSNQEARYDLDGARDAAYYDGMRSVSARCNAQQIRVAEKFLEYCEEPRKWEPRVWWFWGETGVGKSRSAREKAWAAGYEGEHDVYIKNVGNKWWPGYDRHPVVIIDDFRPG